jgi:hypothetical protein
MDCSSCGFDRARSRPAMIIKGANAAFLPAGRFVVQRGPHGGAAGQGQRRLRRDRCRSSLMMDSVKRPHVYPPPPIPPHQPISFCAGTAPKPVGGAAAEEGQDASSALGSGEAFGDDMGKATRAAIARAYEVNRGNGTGEIGAREGGEGGGRGGGGWLRGLSAAAPEVPPDAESGSADRGVPGGSKNEPFK